MNTVKIFPTAWSDSVRNFELGSIQDVFLTENLYNITTLMHKVIKINEHLFTRKSYRTRFHGIDIAIKPGQDIVNTPG